MSENKLQSCQTCLQLLDIFNSVYLRCEKCCNYEHVHCLPNHLIVSGIAGDVFFKYTCPGCSISGEGVVIRDKITWFIAVVLAIHDMASKCSGISNQGYFHWRTHITGFIDRNWQNLFCSNFKRRKNWLGTIAGVLSHHSPSFFLSGAIELGDNGWWKLAHSLQPCIYLRLYNEVTSIRNKERQKVKNKGLVAIPDDQIVLRLLNEYGLKSHYNSFHNKLLSLRTQNYSGINDKDSEQSSSDEENYKNVKRQFVDSDSLEDISCDTKSRRNDSKHCGGLLSSIDTSSSKRNVGINDEDSPDLYQEFDIGIDDNYVDSILGSDDILNWSFNTNSFVTSCDVSDECSSTSNSNFGAALENNARKEDQEELPIKSLFRVREGPRIHPWKHFVYKESSTDISLKPLSIYQEHETHRKLKQYLEIIDKNPNLMKSIDSKKIFEARRLCCKLNVRKQLRKQNHPEFDLDRLMLGELDGIRKCVSDGSHFNVLDKYQVVNTPRDNRKSFATRLTGSCVYSCFVSPYTNRTLKPFIRRDSQTVPPWLKLMNELRMKVNNKNSTRAPIDYCYVRPHHIAAINSLCEQFYWPGIDVTDVLQYPDYTVVALYKKLVVGFGLLVPDANHNEAYISFLWTRPNWQKSGIGSFMLYHLIQTCVGKDITLHVSATNTALILYQKFGFKVEEFIQDFYDKYMPITSRECKHALFLRLCR